MVLLAHIRDQHRLSLGRYGRPRMLEELNELDVQVGQRRVGRLMRQNGLQVVRTRKFKATTDSDHVFNIAPDLPQQPVSLPSVRLAVLRVCGLSLRAPSSTPSRASASANCLPLIGFRRLQPGCASG